MDTVRAHREPTGSQPGTDDTRRGMSGDWDTVFEPLIPRPAPDRSLPNC